MTFVKFISLLSFPYNQMQNCDWAISNILPLVLACRYRKNSKPCSCNIDFLFFSWKWNFAPYISIAAFIKKCSPLTNTNNSNYDIKGTRVIGIHNETSVWISGDGKFFMNRKAWWVGIAQIKLEKLQLQFLLRYQNPRFHTHC